MGGKLILITNRKSCMNFRLVPKSVTSNDCERPLFCVISANSGTFWSYCVKVHVRYLISWWVLVSTDVRRNGVCPNPSNRPAAARLSWTWPRCACARFNKWIRSTGVTVYWRRVICLIWWVWACPMSRCTTTRVHTKRRNWPGTNSLV